MFVLLLVIFKLCIYLPKGKKRTLFALVVPCIIISGSFFVSRASFIREMGACARLAGSPAATKYAYSCSCVSCSLFCKRWRKITCDYNQEVNFRSRMTNRTPGSRLINYKWQMNKCQDENTNALKYQSSSWRAESEEGVQIDLHDTLWISAHLSCCFASSFTSVFTVYVDSYLCLLFFGLFFLVWPLIWPFFWVF